MRGINNFPRQAVYPRLADKGFRAGKSREQLQRQSVILRKAKATAFVMYYQCSGD